MQRNTKKFVRGFIVAFIVALVLLALLTVFYLIPNFLEFKRTLTVPPTVIVYSPSHGEEYPEGSIVSSRATSTATNPIARFELWMDGEMVEQQLPSPDTPLALTTMHATISIKISEGLHMFYWKAIDSKGQIGQSPPISIVGKERLGGGETTQITAEEGQNLQEIAESLGGEPDVLKKLNPDLGEEGLPDGTNVTVPAPLPPGKENQPQGGSIIVDPPVGGNIIVSDPLTIMPANPIIDIGSLISVIASNFPVAPTELEVGFENCIVQLGWKDNAENEQAYHVWMKPGSGTPRLVATLKSRKGTGNASFIFESPSFGIYGFWVEAVNGLGTQPSQVKWLFIDDTTCRGQQAEGLDVEILDLNTGGFSGQLYCYISFEGSPEKRIPEQNFFNDFVNQALQGDYFSMEGKGSVYLIPIPADDEVSIEGKCLGHLGTDVIELGILSKSIPKVQWNGMRLEAQAGDVVLGFKIQQHGLNDPSGLYRYTDNDLSIPRVTTVTARTDRDPMKRSRLARNVILSWAWDGEPQDITNFVIALDEAMEFRVAGINDRTQAIVLPTSCGRSYKFAVAAMSKGGARSKYSTWYEYSQPPCDYYAEVTFDTFVMTDFDDNENLPRHLDCDEAELGFEIVVSSVNRVWRNWDGGLRWHYYGTDTNCNQTYHFTQYPFNKGAPGKRDTFTVLIEPTTSTINIHVRFADLDNFIVAWDSDNICRYNQTITMPEDEWAGYSGSYSEICQEAANGEQDGKVQINYYVKGYRTPSE